MAGDETIGAMGSISEAAPAARTTTRHRVRRLRVTRDGLSTLVFLLPFLVVFGLFAWFPILRGFVMSVQETNLVSEPTFVGIENFQRVLADPLLGKAIGNTLWFTLLALVVGYPIPIILGVLMSEVRRGRGLYSALAYLPVVVPPVVAVLLWRFFYDASPNGVFNTILGWVGLGPLPWLQNATSAMPSIVIEATWAGAGAHGHHLSRRAGRGPARAVRRGRGRWRLDLAEDLAHHPAAAAQRPVPDPHPPAHRDVAAVHRAVPVHRRRTGQRDDDRAPAHLQVRLPEQPRR